MTDARERDDEVALEFAFRYSQDGLSDALIREAADHSDNAAEFGEKLASAKRTLMVDEARDKATAEAEKRLGKKFAEATVELNLGHRDEPEPDESEPEFGRWKPPEGTVDVDFDSITDAFNEGRMPYAKYIQLEAEHARSLGEEPLH